MLVDFHAEATSEKQALAFHLDGRVSAVLGTHTHVPTADERVLPGGTALLTDVGMTGPYDSIIGFRADKVLRALPAADSGRLRGRQARRAPGGGPGRRRRDDRQGALASSGSCCPTRGR